MSVSHSCLCASTEPRPHRQTQSSHSFALGESISISIDQQSRYHVALTWESISHLGCLASLDFYGPTQDKDMKKSCIDPMSSLFLP